MSDYSSADIKAALDKLPLGRGDIIFCHSNIGFFGRSSYGTYGDVCEAFFDALMARLGYEGTLCVPTFTYSFQRGEVFDPDCSVSSMGVFAEWIRKHEASTRSDDPCYSVC